MNSDQCMSCIHYQGGEPGRLGCAAFDHIPQEIIEGTVDHREPHEGDGGTQWEPVPGITAADVFGDEAEPTEAVQRKDIPA